MFGKIGRNDGTMLSYEGHGIIERYRADLSIAGVMGHELGHVNSYRRRALVSGEMLEDVHISLDLVIIGGKIIAIGGEARATFVRRKESGESAGRENNIRTGGLNDNRHFSEESELSGVAQINSRNKEELERKILVLRKRLEVLSEIEKSGETRKLNTGLRGEKLRIESELSKLERALVELELLEAKRIRPNGSQSIMVAGALTGLNVDVFV